MKAKLGLALTICVMVLAPLAGCDDDDEEDPPVARAPFVYLYPEAAGEVTVTLTPAEGTELIISEPSYDNGWTVWATPSGVIDGNLDYLFYESTVSWVFQQERGWTVAADEILPWLQSALPELNLNEVEAEDFMDYWSVHLPYAPCYRVFPQDDELISQTMGLAIEPEPDTLIRFWLVIEGADRCDSLPAPELSTIQRRGFTAVEWGVVLDGLQLD